MGEITNKILRFGFVLIIGFVISTPMKANGLSSEIDSLIHTVNQSNNSDEKIELHLEISQRYYSSGNIKLALTYTRKAQSLIMHYTSTEIVAKVHLFLGCYLLELGKFANALDQFQLSYEMYSQVDNKTGVARSLGNMGVVFERMNNPEIALEYGRRVIMIYTESNDSVSLAGTYTNMGNIYMDLEKYELALSYHKDALAIDLKLADPIEVSTDYNNLGFIFQKLKEEETALWYYQKSFELDRENQDIYNMAIVLVNIGSILMKQDQLDAALDTTLRSLELAHQSGSVLQQIESNKLLSEIQEKRGDYESAFEYFRSYMKLSELLEEEHSSITEVEALRTIQQSEIVPEDQLVHWQNRIRDVIIALLAIVLFGLVAWMLFYLIRNL